MRNCILFLLPYQQAFTLKAVLSLYQVIFWPPLVTDTKELCRFGVFMESLRQILETLP